MYWSGSNSVQGDGSRSVKEREEEGLPEFKYGETNGTFPRYSGH